MIGEKLVMDRQQVEYLNIFFSKSKENNLHARSDEDKTATNGAKGVIMFTVTGNFLCR